MADTSTTRPLAVVTGASSGIGLELARQFAEHGFDLVIAAEDTAIADAAQDLTGTGGAHVHAVQADLATDTGVDELVDRISELGRPVDALALNAGVGANGRFVDLDLDRQLNIIDLNVRGLVHLAHDLVPAMVRRGEGRVLFTSSIASTQPGPYQAIYNASKSFVQSFALALREELKDTGVTVTSLMPGPTDTDFFRRADLEDTRLARKKDDPADVAEQGVDALMEGDAKVVAASLFSKAMGKTGRFVPDTVKAKAHGVMARPGSAD